MSNRVLLILLSVLIAPGGAAAEQQDLVSAAREPVSMVKGKKLIRVASELCSRFAEVIGPSMADADLPARVKIWQHTGLDGMAFSMATHDSSKLERNMSGQWWKQVPITYEELRPEIEAFKSVKDWGRLTDNFLWGGGPGSIWGEGDPGIAETQDWFNDDHWKIILSNVKLQARIARELKFKGIMMDVEQYHHHGRGPWRFPFDYHYYAESGYKLTGEVAPRPLSQVADKVYHRAQQYGRAICQVYPGLTLFLIPAIYRPNDLTDREILFPAFLDGLVAGLDDDSPLLLGSERTYLYSQYSDMAIIRDGTIAQMCSRSRDPDRLRQKLSFAVGIWTDGGHTDGGGRRYSDTDVSINHRDPERHKHAVHNALAASDHYGWLYGENSYYLATDPTPLTRRYLQANTDGHFPQDLNWQPEPKWDMADYTDHDAQMAAIDARFWSEIGAEGYRVAFEFPEYWHFYYDTEERGSSINWEYPHAGWPKISTLRCWQSQSIKANGEGVYRVNFDAPVDLNPRTQQIFLAFGGFPADHHDSWTVVRLNGKGYQIKNLLDVSDRIRPGANNFLAVELINKVGPGGPLGHVKLLVRNRKKQKN